MKDKDPNEIERTTLFHGGFDYIKRMDEIFKALDQITISRDRGPANERTWRTNLSLLNSLLKEIYPKMTLEEQKEHDTGYEVMSKAMNFAISNPKAVGGKTRYNVGFLKMFDDFEKSLRCVAEKKGLMMPDKKDMSEAADL